MTSPPGRVIGALSGGELVPEAGTVYWVDTTILPSGGLEEIRPVVVVAAPETVDGTVTVVARSGTDDFGVVHPADPLLGLSTPGRFSRLHPVQRRLWTSWNVTPIGRLDGTVLAAVVARFVP